MSFEQKYYKYKAKYLALRSLQKGGLFNSDSKDVHKSIADVVKGNTGVWVQKHIVWKDSNGKIPTVYHKGEAVLNKKHNMYELINPSDPAKELKLGSVRAVYKCPDDDMYKGGSIYNGIKYPAVLASAPTGPAEEKKVSVESKEMILTDTPTSPTNSFNTIKIRLSKMGPSSSAPTLGVAHVPIQDPETPRDL